MDQKEEKWNGAVAGQNLIAMSQSDAATSLLSLSIAAASAAPISLQHQRSSSSDGGGISSSVGRDKTHRRLASTGKTRRRLSDAREAAARPNPAALSLASLSLSASPPSTTTTTTNDDGSKPIPIASGKKRAIEHKCESCSKIYRHPSCLIKHRWEHTPHWREASKFVLSKHQQVQLLEAAAILSHLSPTSSSLPEDRSLWPSFLSGGSLPPPNQSTLVSSPDSSKRSVSASVNTGPRMHDYSIPINTSSTQLRPGLLGIPTTSTTTITSTTSIPVTTPSSAQPHQHQPMSVPITSSHSWSSVSVSNPIEDHTNTNTTVSSVLAAVMAGTRWSLPRSSIRSVSSHSRSRSRSASDDEHDDDINEDDEFQSEEDSFRARYIVHPPYSHHRTRDEKSTNKDWDGMELEMDMD